MSSKTLGLDQRLYAYLLANGVREAPALARLREATRPLSGAVMQISPEQGALMQMLVRLTGATRCLEIGVFTGYSALAVALALPAEGRILALDINPETTALARRHWEEAGVAGKIELRLAPAAETLQALIDEGQAESFDFAFIDADKQGYGLYVERSLALLRRGGLIAIDNVLWSGAVADPAREDADTLALRRLNAGLAQDERVDLCMLPIGDGLTLARKR